MLLIIPEFDRNLILDNYPDAVSFHETGILDLAQG